MSAPLPVLNVPALLARPGSDGKRQVAAPLFDIPGFPLPQPSDESGLSKRVGDEIDDMLEQSRRVRDEFSRKRTDLLKEYQAAEKSVEKLLVPPSQRTRCVGCARVCVSRPVAAPPPRVPPCHPFLFAHTSLTHCVCACCVGAAARSRSANGAPR